MRIREEDTGEEEWRLSREEKEKRRQNVMLYDVEDEERRGGYR